MILLHFLFRAFRHFDWGVDNVLLRNTPKIMPMREQTLWSLYNVSNDLHPSFF